MTRGRICRQDHITRADLRANPNTLYVFGDNMARSGRGGQAREMRGEPNAVGIPTKWAPGMRAQDFFKAGDLRAAQPEIDRAFHRLRLHLASGGDVVIPSAGIGTGLAELERRAPAIFNYIEGELVLLDKARNHA